MLQGVSSPGDLHLGEFKPSDQFANPMYESAMYEVTEDKTKLHPDGNDPSAIVSPSSSAVLSPSSIVHKAPPPVKQTAWSPTSVDTDKDTHKLMEEDTDDN